MLRFGTSSRNGPTQRYSLLLGLGLLVLTACGGGQTADVSSDEPVSSELSTVTSSAEVDQPGGESSTPIDVGLLASTTGYLSSFDEPLAEGVEAAVQRINDMGGIGGRAVELHTEDIESAPETMVVSLQRILDDSAPDALILGASSAANAAAAPIGTQAEIPMVVASVVPDDPTFSFSTLDPVTFELETRVGYMEQNGYTRVGILRDASPYNQLQVDSAEELLSNSEITIVAIEQHETDATDLRTHVTSLLNEQPDVIWKLSGGPTHIVAATALAQANSTIPLLLSLDATEIHSQAAQAYAETYSVAGRPQIYPALEQSEISDSLAAFVEEGNIQSDLNNAARGWDATYILAQALEESNGAVGSELRDALVRMGPYEGARGSYDFTDDSHYGISTNPLMLVQFVGETIEIVFRPDN